MTTIATTKLYQLIITGLIKLTIIVLLYFAIQPEPYHYYETMRVIICLLFAMLGAQEFKNKEALLCAFCWGCAALFQPIKKVEMGRNSWVVIDEVVLIAVAVWIIIEVVLYFKIKRVTFKI